MGPNGLNDLAPEGNDLYADLNQAQADTPGRAMSALAKLRKGVVHIRYNFLISYSVNCKTAALSFLTIFRNRLLYMQGISAKNAPIRKNLSQ